MDDNAAVANTKAFRGWWVIAGLFVVLMTSSGMGFYAQSVFLNALVRERGWSTGVTSTGTAVFFVVSGLAGYLAAPYMQRIDVRRIIVVGSLIAACGLLLIGRAEAEWQMFGANVVFGIGFALSGLVPATTTVARWFVRRRSVALSVASTGLSAGGIVVTPFVASLVKSQGIAAVTPWLALVWVAVSLPVTIFVVRSSPAAVGQYPDGDPAPASGGPLAPPAGYTFAEARRTRFYAFAAAAYLCIMFGQVGGIAQQVKLVTERQEWMAALSVTVVAGSSVCGRLAGGVVASRYPVKKFSTVLIVVQGVALAMFAFAETSTMLLVTCVIFGLSVGNLLMLQPLLLADAFGVREYPRIYSFAQLITTIGVGVGPSAMGVLHDLSDYRLSYLVAAGSSALAFVLFLAAGPAEQHQRVVAERAAAAAVPA
ncbi:MAG: MFS transporter [Actinobacteria bacterium]|nr:MFS transporter [Actinomycetota bacterium]